MKIAVLVKQVPGSESVLPISGEQTWIDGRRYFDLEEDRVMRKQVEKERMMLIQKLLKPKKKMDMKPEA